MILCASHVLTISGNSLFTIIMGTVSLSTHNGSEDLISFTRLKFLAKALNNMFFLLNNIIFSLCGKHTKKVVKKQIFI